MEGALDCILKVSWGVVGMVEVGVCNCRLEVLGGREGGREGGGFEMQN